MHPLQRSVRELHPCTVSKVLIQSRTAPSVILVITKLVGPNYIHIQISIKAPPHTNRTHNGPRDDRDKYASMISGNSVACKGKTSANYH